VGIAGALLAGSLCFAAAGWTVYALALPIVPLFVLTAAALAAAIVAFPRRTTAQTAGPKLRNDLVLRMLVAAVVVLGITSAASTLGPRLSGLLTGYPVMASILASFAYRSFGPGGARLVLGGLLLGLYGFATFFLVLGIAIEPLGIPVGFALALTGALLVHGVALAVMWRRGTR